MKVSLLPSQYERYLFGEGNNFQSYSFLGAHSINSGNLSGVRFCVWAPRAKSVSLIGDFNNWDESKTKMELIEESGIWWSFVPNLKEGSL